MPRFGRRSRRESWKKSTGLCQREPRGLAGAGSSRQGGIAPPEHHATRKPDVKCFAGWSGKVTCGVRSTFRRPSRSVVFSHAALGGMLTQGVTPKSVCMLLTIHELRPMVCHAVAQVRHVKDFGFENSSVGRFRLALDYDERLGAG